MKKRAHHHVVLAAETTKDQSPPKASVAELVAELEALDVRIRRKLDIAPPAALARYEAELFPKLEALRKLAHQNSPMARNAAEDAIVRFREVLLTPAGIV